MIPSRKKKSRTYNIRRIRLTLSYSVQEIAELFKLHKNAVLIWVKNGLQTIDERRPYLIQGSELASYLRQKQTTRKHKCKANEIFCFKCRLPRTLNAEPDIQIRAGGKLLISGNCSVCGTRMNRAGAEKKLDHYRKIYSRQAMPERHINECVGSIANSEKRKDDEHEQIQPQE